MLSYLYRLATGFQHSHGYRPNLVYLNRLHYRMLQENLAGMAGEDEIARFLGIDVVISPDIRHPDVAWMSHGRQKSVAGHR